MTDDLDPALNVAPGELDPHFIARLLACAARRKIDAAADVVATSRAKLIVAGTLIDADVLLRLKGATLMRPLEDCLGVRDGVNSAQVIETAERLLAQYPLLARIDEDKPEATLIEVLGQLRLTPSMQALLTVYADEREGRLEHAVSVALLTLALARRLLPGKGLLHRQLTLAGLLHDIGELFIPPIPPITQDRQAPLSPAQWRSIASHPVIGSRVLARMEGAGPVVAEAVLSHHERLDGFGYPRGLANEDFFLPSQLLAVAEWLAGLLEQGPDWLLRATVASRLIPGEFSPRVLEPIHKALRGTAELSEWMASQYAALGDATPAGLRAPQGFGAVQQWIATHGVTASPALRGVMLKAYQRLHRLQASFVGAGLNLDDPERVQADLGDPEARLELGALVTEFGWRVRELERACLLRAALLGEDDLSVVNEMLEMFRSE
ncbi:HD-GYP domain-containing protein [Burkholderiaceae bacterium UC74_6]